MFFYDNGLLQNFSATVFNELHTCYNKCIKVFLKSERHYRVTDMLHELELSRFEQFYCLRVGRFHFSGVG